MQERKDSSEGFALQIFQKEPPQANIVIAEPQGLWKRPFAGEETSHADLVGPDSLSGACCGKRSTQAASLGEYRTNNVNEPSCRGLRPFHGIYWRLPWEIFPRKHMPKAESEHLQDDSVVRSVKWWKVSVTGLRIDHFVRNKQNRLTYVHICHTNEQCWSPVRNTWTAFSQSSSSRQCVCPTFDARTQSVIWINAPKPLQ